MLIEYDLFADLAVHGGGIFDFPLHSLVLLEELVELFLYFGEVGLLLFGLRLQWLHGLKGNPGEGSAVGGFIVGVVEYAHFSAIAEVGLDLAFEAGLAVDGV